MAESYLSSRSCARVISMDHIDDVVIFENDKLRLEIKDNVALINGTKAIDKFIAEKIIPTPDRWIAPLSAIEDETNGEFTSCGCLMGLLYSHVSGGPKAAKIGYDGIDPYKDDPVDYIARQVGIPIEIARSMEQSFTWGDKILTGKLDQNAFAFGLLVRGQSEAFINKQRKSIRVFTNFLLPAL